MSDRYAATCSQALPRTRSGFRPSGFDQAQKDKG